MDQQVNSRKQRKQLEEQKRRGNKQKSNGKKPNRSLFKKIIIAVLALGIALFVIGASIFAIYAAQAPKLDEELLKDPVSTKFFDSNGKVFYTMGNQEREHVDYDNIPKDMRDAILATEDSRFFKHHGIDFVRLGGAVLANFRFGFGAQGGSTLTQQVIKNSFLNNGKTLKRKAQEAYLAIQLEREYSKEEIFEMYFNKVLMSGQTFGFGTAAKKFYGKNLKDLTLDEKALLAGMPQAPNAYNPFKNPDRAEKRRNIVLGLMYQHKVITKEQMEKARKVDIKKGLLPESKRQTTASKYDAFIDVVLKELSENKDEKALEEGVSVYTTLDTNAQKVVESTMNNSANFPTKDIQAGLSVIDTKTGAIVAVGGGRNYGPERGFNYAEALNKRQPGSTMKPLVDYGPAIENLKWSTGKTIVDEPMNYTGSSQPINNFDHQYKGSVTIRQALYNSRNIPAVKTFKEVGADKAKAFVKNLGINTNELYEADAIGGGNISLTPIEMASAYAAFGNNGIYTAPHAIKKIVYRDGKTSKSYTPDPVPAMSDYTAFMVTDMLRDVVSSKYGASGSAAGIPGLDVAGKTGTTNYSTAQFSEYGLPASAVPDSWFAGYTTNYSIAVWGGYTDYKSPITTNEEKLLPQKLFKTIMSQISANKETPNFKQPNSVVRVGNELYVKGQQPVAENKDTEEEKKEDQELHAPSGLKATYDENAKAVNLSWSHDHPEDQSVRYKVSVSVDGGGSQSLTETSNTSYTYGGPEDGKTYVFSVVAVMDGKTSDAATTSIQIKAPEKEPEEPKTDENESPEQPGEVEQPTPPTEEEQPGDENENEPPAQEQEPGDNNGQDDGNANDEQVNAHTNSVGNGQGNGNRNENSNNGQENNSNNNRGNRGNSQNDQEH